jgi:hypothetical protein
MLKVLNSSHSEGTNFKEPPPNDGEWFLATLTAEHALCNGRTIRLAAYIKMISLWPLEQIIFMAK